MLFKTLSDPTRLRLLNLLAGGDTCVCELTDTLRVVQPKVSRHLARLKRAGLVDARREMDPLSMGAAWRSAGAARPGRVAGMDDEKPGNERRAPPAQKGLLQNQLKKTEGNENA